MAAEEMNHDTEGLNLFIYEKRPGGSPIKSTLSKAFFGPMDFTVTSEVSNRAQKWKVRATATSPTDHDPRVIFDEAISKSYTAWVILRGHLVFIFYLYFIYLFLKK